MILLSPDNHLLDFLITFFRYKFAPLNVTLCCVYEGNHTNLLAVLIIFGWLNASNLVGINQYFCSCCHFNEFAYISILSLNQYTFTWVVASGFSVNPSSLQYTFTFTLEPVPKCLLRFPLSKSRLIFRLIACFNPLSVEKVILL